MPYCERWDLAHVHIPISNPFLLILPISNNFVIWEEESQFIIVKNLYYMTKTLYLFPSTFCGISLHNMRIVMTLILPVFCSNWMDPFRSPSYHSWSILHLLYLKHVDFNPTQLTIGNIYTLRLTPPVLLFHVSLSPVLAQHFSRFYCQVCSSDRLYKQEISCDFAWNIFIYTFILGLTT